MKTVAVLPKKVASKFETTSGFNVVLYQGRKIDLRKISLEDAKALAEDSKFGLISKKANVTSKKA